MDATSKELSQSTKLLLAAATQLAITLATQKRQALQKAATQSEQTARQVQKLQNAELAAAKPMIAKSQGGLDALSPQELADTYQACQTWKDIDPEAKQGSAAIEAHLDALDPTWKDTSQTAKSDAPPTHKRSSATDQELRAAVTTARLGKLAAVDAWATEQLKNGAHPDYVRGTKLAKLTQPSDPTKRSTIGLHDDDDGPASLGHSHGLTL